VDRVQVAHQSAVQRHQPLHARVLLHRRHILGSERGKG
jgi:hypothetical protein